MSSGPRAILVAAILSGAGQPKRASDLVLELAEVPSLYDHGSLSLAFRAAGKGDVYFNRAAVRVEIRPPRQGLLKYGCADKRDLTSLIDPVRLHPGETTSKNLETHCYHPVPGLEYNVTAVFDDKRDDFLGQPPDGAIRVTGPIRSNTIVTRLLDAHNQPLQADGPSRRR
jgi:hypothetical protein